jgi:hypothetical protein
MTALRPYSRWARNLIITNVTMLQTGSGGTKTAFSIRLIFSFAGQR